MLPHRRWSFEELAQWFRWGKTHERMPDLLQVHRMMWPKNTNEFDRAYSEVDSALPADGCHLAAQCLTSAVFVRRLEVPSWLASWIQNNLTPKSLDLPWSWPEMLAAQWVLAAIPLSLGDRNHMAWCAIGWLPGVRGGMQLPSWWGAVADQDAADAVQRALEFARPDDCGQFLFWPLLGFHDRLQIHGPSLALAVHLPAWGLARGVLNCSLVATGNIDANRYLAPVGSLAGKAEAAAHNGFHGILFPKKDLVPRESLGCIEAIPVDDLDQAQFFWEAFTAGQSKVLWNDYLCLKSPEHLAANVHRLSSAVIARDRFAEAYRHQIEAVLADEALAELFVGNLERGGDKSNGDLHSLYSRLQPLTPERLMGLASRSPVVALRAAHLQLSWANHHGSPEDSKVWAELITELSTSTRAYEEAIPFRLLGANCELVGDRHNRYDFRPNLPDQLLAELEKQKGIYALRKMEGVLVCRQLGAAYGTIAQNYGFCGPNYVDSVKAYVALAQEAFGNGKLKGYEQDWRRGFNYLAYAFLDSDRWEEAQEALVAYLGVKISGLDASRICELNPYQHALLARFLAETGMSLRWYHEWAKGALNNRPQSHPWQLWLYNVGFLCQEREDRIRAWQMSSASCMQQGPTVQAMGLLPLSALWQEGHHDMPSLETIASQLSIYVREGVLASDHFVEMLRRSSADELMKFVVQEKARLFPFSYR